MGFWHKDYRDLYMPQVDQEIIVTHYDDRTMGYQMAAYRGIPVNPALIRRMLLVVAEQLRQALATLPGQAAVRVEQTADGTRMTAGFNLLPDPDPVTLARKD